MMRFFSNAWTSDRPCGWLGAVLLAAVIAPGSGCTKDHCENDTHCRPGEQCNLETNRCYASDVDAGDAGADAGDAEPTECTGHGDCTEPTEPVCLLDICQPCGTSAQCFEKDEVTPICNAGACEPCSVGSSDCETDWPNKPGCLSSGQCVPCTDSATHCVDPNPICDPTNHTCRPCEAHSECDYLGGVDKGICDWDTSTCVDPANIIYVNNDGGPCNSSGQGLAGDPFCQIHEALLSATVSATRFTVLVEQAIYEPIHVSDSVRLLSRSNAEIATTASVTIVNVTGTSTDLTDLIVEGFVIRGANTGWYGVECAAATTVTLLNNTINSNGGGGVKATDCTITLKANEIYLNPGGGVFLDNSDGTVINNMIYENGTTMATWGGVRLSGATNTVIFHSNTVVDNTASLSSSMAAGVYCVDSFDVVSSIVDGVYKPHLSSLCTAYFSYIGDGSGHISSTDNIDASVFTNPGLDPPRPHASVQLALHRCR